MIFIDCCTTHLPDIGKHVLAIQKHPMLRDKLRSDRRFAGENFVLAQPLDRDDLLLVHTTRYVNDLLTLRLTESTERSELPLTQELVDAILLASGGTLQAAREALKTGRAMNLSGGFHHAFAEHAEGFCYVNDVAVAVRRLQEEKLVKQILIIDLDVHQGNGTAHIFKRDRSVFTFSMHERENYPVKQKGRLDVGLETGCGDEEYLALLQKALHGIRSSFKPDLIFYLAGVDVHRDDMLGGLSLTREGIRLRDEMVRDFLPEVPLAVVMAGGYARKIEGVVDLHFQTCEVMASII